jgi:DnaJ-domain-containing protein 1
MLDMREEPQRKKSGSIVRGGQVLPVQALLRPPLREPARKQDDIRKAHRKLVRKYHPDTNSGDPPAGNYPGAAPLGASEE